MSSASPAAPRVPLPPWADLPAAHAAGVAILLMIVASVAHGAGTGVPQWVAGVLGWIAGVLLFGRVRGPARIQVMVMMACGAATILWCLTRDQAPLELRPLVANESLLAMLGAVSFLRLVSQPRGGSNEALPVGPRALLRTLGGVHLFGA